MRPNFFIVGAPKCGTTAINDYLAQHPDIFMATKELHYFGKDLKTRINLSEEEYQLEFQGATNEKIKGEASVWYLYSKNAAREIKAYSPHAKILIMLRNPIEVIHSLHSQHLYDGNEDVLDFETAIGLDEDRKKGKRLPRSVDFLQLPPYLESVRYAEQVKRYFEVFGMNNVHIILYDDFVKETNHVVKKVLQFLGVNTEINLAYPVVNPNKEIKNFYLHRLIKSPATNIKNLVRVLLPFKLLRHFLMKQILDRNIRIKRRKAINEELNLRLKQYFEDDIKLLSKLIERDLSAWME